MRKVTILMPINVVYAIGSEMVTLTESGTTWPVQKGSHWPAGDPVVRERPHLFSPDPRYGLIYSAAPPGYDDQLGEVETTDAVPGEKRYARRT
jgi:hypothetical protein